jgi:CBS domain-containing protein
MQRPAGYPKLEHVKIDEVMTKRVVTVPLGATLADATPILVANRISGAPVVDPEGRVVGVLSEADCLSHPAGAETTVAEAMSAPARTIEPGQRINEAARIMVEAHINRLPVVDEAKLVGIVSRADLVRALAVQEIEDAIETRVLEREALHQADADAAVLETNRLAIGRLQQQLSRALIAEHTH